MERTARLSMAWLRRQGYIDESSLEGRSDEQTALEACADIAMGRGTVATLSRDGQHDAADRYTWPSNT